MFVDSFVVILDYPTKTLEAELDLLPPGLHLVPETDLQLLQGLLIVFEVESVGLLLFQLVYDRSSVPLDGLLQRADVVIRVLRAQHTLRANVLSVAVQAVVYQFFLVLDADSLILMLGGFGDWRRSLVFFLRLRPLLLHCGLEELYGLPVEDCLPAAQRTHKHVALGLALAVCLEGAIYTDVMAALQHQDVFW